MDNQPNQATAVNALFGPLSRDYCLYFYFLSVIGFVFIAMFLISSLMLGFNQKKGPEYYLQVFAVALGYGIFYFQNRLLNSMCYSALTA